MSRLSDLPCQSFWHGTPVHECIPVAARTGWAQPECCCEVSPPEFGGRIPDRECPLHGEVSS